MAGDWIPIRTTLPKCRKVLAIARRTGRNRHEVIGLLVEFWTWASCETVDGLLKRLTTEDLCATVGADKAFWQAVCDEDWLEVLDAGLRIPNADEWLSRAGKARLQKNLRQFRWRSGGDKNVDAGVGAPTSTRAPTTEQNRTEQNSKSKPPIVPLEKQLIERWNAITDVCQVRGQTLSKKRQTHFKARCKGQGWLDDYPRALAKFPLKCFAGKNEWRPTLDWFLRPDTVTRILEGNYDWAKGPGQQPAKLDLRLRSEVPK